MEEWFRMQGAQDSMVGGPRVLVAMLGGRRGYLVPRALEEHGLLEAFYTDLGMAAGEEGERGVRASVLGMARSLGLRRIIPGVDRKHIHEFWGFGLRRVLWRRIVRGHAATMAAILRDNRRFASMVAAADWGSANTVYAFSSTGLEIFLKARRSGMRIILDQISVPWAVEEELLRRESELWPGWERDGVRTTCWRALAEREREEWKLADAIICGSEFVAESVARDGGPREKCVVVPYGMDPARIMERPRGASTGPLKVLFAGRVELRKGIQYLAAALERLGGGYSVRAVGAIHVSRKAIGILGKYMRLEGHVDPKGMEAAYRWADVFVLPTLAEGSANVCYEALAAGLPVITTPNAGSIVRDGIEGFIVPARDVEGLAQRLGELEGSRDKLPRMSAAALERIRQYTLDKYARRVCAVIEGEGWRRSDEGLDME